MYRLIAIFFFIFIVSQIEAQKLNKEQLIVKIENEKDYQKKIGFMIDLAHLDIETDSAAFFKQINLISSLSESHNFIKGKAECEYNLGDYYSSTGKFDVSNIHFQKARELFSKTNNKKRLADTYTFIGINYSELSMFDKSLEPYINSEKLYNELHDTAGLIQTDINIGVAYSDIKLNDKATIYYKKALQLALLINDKENSAYCYSNLGVQEKKAGNFDKALDYYIKLETIANQLSDKYLLGTAYINMANVFLIKKELYKANRLALKYLKLNENSNDPSCLYYGYIVLGNSEFDLGDTKKGINNLLKALEKAKEVNAGALILQASDNLAEAYEKISEFKKAYFYKKTTYQLSDSIFGADNIKRMSEIETKYQTEKKEIQIEALNKDKKLQNLELERKQKELRNRNVVIIGIAIVLIIIILFSALLYRTLQQKRKANMLLASQKQVIEIQNANLHQANEEISAQRDEIEAQRDLVTIQKEQIEKIHKEVTDSIKYAKRIQEAVLPKSDVTRSILGEHFILFKPKDIVSGDFYWATTVFSRGSNSSDTPTKVLVVAVADCTGHGVPGAFMSMLGISFLNEIVHKQHITKANQVLIEMRKEIINALRQQEKFDGQSDFTKVSPGQMKDGMDIALCVINTCTDAINRVSTYNLQYAGANNPLYIVSGNPLRLRVSEASKFQASDGTINLKHETCNFKLQEVKGDKMPIAIHERMDEFTNHEIELQKGDMLYLTSDGYKDQFGGTNNSKFKIKQFKELLLSVAGKPLKEQKDILDLTFEQWKGEHEQVDDVTVLGLKI